MAVADQRFNTKFCRYSTDFPRHLSGVGTEAHYVKPHFSLGHARHRHDVTTITINVHALAGEVSRIDRPAVPGQSALGNAIYINRIIEYIRQFL